MWKWLEGLFSSPKPEPQPEPLVEIDEPEPLPPSMTQRDLVLQNLKVVARDTIREMAEEQARREAELLASGKLQQLVQTALKYIAKELQKTESYDFILIHDNNVGIQKDSWEAFKKIILIPLLKEFDIPATDNGEYIKVDKAPVRRALSKMLPPAMDIDESMRELLHTGVYR